MTPLKSKVGSGLLAKKYVLHANKNLALLCPYCVDMRYLTLSVRAVRDWTFANTTFGVVYSYMKKTNLPSSAVARAGGMTLLNEFTDGEGEQTVVYGISREESVRHMDIWETLYQRAKKEYHPEEVSPFIEAHHVICALESEDGTI